MTPLPKHLRDEAEHSRVALQTKLIDSKPAVTHSEMLLYGEGVVEGFQSAYDLLMRTERDDERDAEKYVAPLRLGSLPPVETITRAFLAGRQGMVSRAELEKAVEEAVAKERGRILLAVMSYAMMNGPRSELRLTEIDEIVFGSRELAAEAGRRLFNPEKEATK